MYYQYDYHSHCTIVIYVLLLFMLFQSIYFDKDSLCPFLFKEPVFQS